jgi:hypothetical protein
MEDNLKNLEQFFREKFSKNPTPEPWNTPDDTVWNGIKNKLEEPKKEKKRGVFWLPLLIGLLGLASTGYFYFQSKNYQNKVILLEEKLETCALSKVNSDVNEEKIVANLEQVNSKTKDANEINFSNASNKLGLKESLKSKKSITDGYSDRVMLNYSVSSQLTKFENTSALKFENTIYSNIEKNTASEGKNTVEITTPQSIKSLPLLPLLIAFPDLNFQYIENQNEVKTNKVNKLLQIGLNSQIILWEDRTTGKLTAPLSELLKDEYTKSSFSYGIAVKYGFSKHFSLDINANYANRKQHSIYELNVPYTLNTEQLLPNTGYENTFNHSLPSSLGNVNTTLTLSRSLTSQVNDQEEINLDVEFQQENKTLFVPLQLSFYHQKVGKGLFGSIGINNEIQLSSDVNVIKATSNHSSIREKNLAITQGNLKSNKYTLHGNVGLGYQMAINPKLSTIAMVGYNRALKDKFKTTGFSHKIDHWTLSLGLLKSIN